MQINQLKTSNRMNFRQVYSVTLLFTFVVFGFFSSVKAEDGSKEIMGLTNIECLRQHEIISIQNELKIVAPQGFSWNEKSRCDETNPMVKLFRAILFVKNGKFSQVKASTDDSIKGFFTDQTPYEFLKSNIPKIGFDRCNGSMLGYTSIFSPHLTICVNTQSDRTVLDWAATLIHETRHIEARETFHVECTRNLSRKGNICDSSTSGDGAYKYELEFLNTIFKFGLNYTSEVKAAARTYAFILQDQVFNKPGNFKTIEGIALRDSNNNIFVLTLMPDIHIINLNRSIQEKIFDPEYNADLILFKDDHTFERTTLYDESRSHKLDTVQSLYNRIPLSIKGMVYDYISPTGFRWCMIEGNNLRFGYRENWSERTRQLPTLERYRCVNPIICGRDKTFKGILIRSESQKTYEVNFIGERSNDIPTFIEVEGCKNELIYQASLQGRSFGINHYGDLLEQVGSSWLPVKEVKNKKFNFMSSQKSIQTFYLDLLKEER